MSPPRRANRQICHAGSHAGGWSVAALLLAFAALPPAPALPQDDPLRHAARLDAEGKCAESEPFYQQALAQGAPSPALLNNLGNHYLICQQPDKAQRYFEQLLAANPSHPNANLQLARLATDRKEGAKALEYLARVQETDLPVLLLRAEASHWAGQTETAVDILDELEKRATGDPRVLFTLGLTAARIGLYARAERAFSAVLTQYPGDFDVLMNLGRAAARASHYERARGVLETALRVRPNDADALFELGQVHAALDDPSRAVFLLAQARKQSPKRPDILLALARAAEAAGYYGDSALALDEYLALQPGDAAARRDHARVCAQTETRRDEGLAELRAYIAKHPADPRGHFDLAYLTWEDTPEPALDHLATAVRLDPGFAAAHLSRGWLLHRQGRTEEAVPHLETAVRLQPESLRALDQLGLAYLTLDKAPAAEKTLRKALALAPEDPEVLLHLGRTLMALDRADEAQQFLTKFRNVRPPQGRDQGKEARMIELASLSPAERRQREIKRFREWSESRPDEAEFQLHLATLLLADGQTSAAIAEFRQLAAKNSNAEIREKAGRQLLATGEYALARDFLSQAVSERPAARLDLASALLHTAGPDAALASIADIPDDDTAGDYLLMRARLLDAANRPDDALEALQQGLRHSNTRPDLARPAALLLLRHEQPGQALAVLDNAIAAAPESPDLLLTKATTLALTDRPDAAETTLKQIESRWPEWDRPYLVHGLLLEQTGNPTAARQKLQTALALGSDPLAPRCALARLDDADAPDQQCECVETLHHLLFPPCAQP